ncbi:hypothetical protein K438DRAFT_2110729 [Mycena galopus ATCC 62051]|nr:hypothetical protein K438DRAFT_2110729 [Mycena galopus ATCC 62051]
MKRTPGGAVFAHSRRPALPPAFPGALYDMHCILLMKIWERAATWAVSKMQNMHSYFFRETKLHLLKAHVGPRIRHSTTHTAGHDLEKTVLFCQQSGANEEIKNSFHVEVAEGNIGVGTWKRVALRAILIEYERSGPEPQRNYEHKSTINRLARQRQKTGGGISAYAKNNDENVMLCQWLKLGLPKNPYLTVDAPDRRVGVIQEPQRRINISIGWQWHRLEWAWHIDMVSRVPGLRASHLFAHRALDSGEWLLFGRLPPHGWNRRRKVKRAGINVQSVRTAGVKVPAPESENHYMERIRGRAPMDGWCAGADYRGRACTRADWTGVACSGRNRPRMRAANFSTCSGRFPE